MHSWNVSYLSNNLEYSNASHKLTSASWHSNIYNLSILSFLCHLNLISWHYKKGTPTPRIGNHVQNSGIPNNISYPQRLSASTVSVVCARANCTFPVQQPPMQQVGKDMNCVDYYTSSDPNCLPPPPLSSSCSHISQSPQPQLQPLLSCNNKISTGQEMNTDCKCFSPLSQTRTQQDVNPSQQRFRKHFETNDVHQRVNLCVLA